ncbi:type II toxin-antitoxin system HicB family antitoxin [Streptomyces sp. ICN441]|uniref:Type II toxin-antitoxin system HicB family antitoxin n=1 Tax=Streptomyces tirandamycinicus TaxID=2174846 RepID=A0A2S1SRM5_9ACTN|nr:MULTISPECIES: type II toxin-antitoxin system HicB family antitoxin [Streptomyces]AWI29052.1 type II toxin-antitoxin system HicB family antitoxin [Streptomyces tirandamycinicus]TFE58653.1 type II toxin-antitoxin system HicB family antitoxin [Streptomyces sp. ICN441]
MEPQKAKTTTYHATAGHDGKWWTVSLHDLPEGYGGATQGRTWREAERMAREAIALLLDVESDSFEVVMLPADPEMAAAVIKAEEAREAAETAARRAAEALAQAARVLVDHAVTVRDAGAMLNVSYQQVAKLAPRTAK